MNDKIESVCVYCSSSNKVKKLYKDTASDLGAILAQAGKTVVYGGSKSGLMGIVANSALANGGEVIGVITEHLQDLEVAHTGLTENYVVDTMHERKAMMTDRADAFVILPGSLGTLEELTEVATWRQIGLMTKPIVIVNVDHFWDAYLDLLDRMIQEKCMLEGHKSIFQVVDSPKDVLNALKSFNPNAFDVRSKWAGEEI